ncbi:MAG TPA: GNAT family N-acetyltransferase [Planctomycetota bacterium]|nr:GNAT family N-acetyltransferase [Planctomycetota bacterium]
MPAARRVRIATLRDVPVLARQRVGMFLTMGIRIPAAERARIERGTRAFLRRAIPAGEFVGWVAEVDGAPVSGGGLLLRRLMPRPGFPRGFLEAHVLSVFTEDGHRRQGHARAVMEAIVRWCRARRVARVTLHASRVGRPLYLSMGFAVREELVLYLRRRSLRRRHGNRAATS